MKVITDYFTPPQQKNIKSPQKTENGDSSNNANSDEDDGEVVYSARKIKIRLKDPNDPQSFYCEVYDTSPEVDCKRINDCNEEKGEIRCLRRRRCSRKLKILEGFSSEEEQKKGEEDIYEKRRKSKAKPDKKNQELTSAGGIRNYFQPTVDLTINKKGITKKTQSSELCDNNNDSDFGPAVKENKSNDNNLCDKMPLKQEEGLKGRRRSLRLERQAEKIRVEDHNSHVSEKNEGGKLKRPLNAAATAQNAKRAKSDKLLDSQKVNMECEVVLVRTSLAPVFCQQKKTKLSKIDPEILRARQMFLKNGVNSPKPKVPDNFSSESEVNYFPQIAHVQQRCANPIWKLRPLSITLKKLEDYNQPRVLAFSKPIENTIIINPSPATAAHPSLSIAVEETLKFLEKTYKYVPIRDLYNKYKNYKATDETWNEKYKPEMLGIFDNSKTLLKLQNWLKTWKTFETFNKRERHISNGSSDFFVNSSDDEQQHQQQQRAPETACMLFGPCASGKSAIVFALAKEFEMNVLEINASSKRAGKKMLSDLQEATQSRKLSQQECQNESNNGISLILVEEADVVFDEHDEGFTNGLLQLISSSKRPVILLTDNVDAKHLQRVKQSGLLQLSMRRPNRESACAYLELVLLLENTKIPKPHLLRLLAGNQNDLRKSLNELQFWVENNGKSVWHQINSPEWTLDSIWWRSHAFLFHQVLWQPPLPKATRKSYQSDLFDVSDSDGESTVSVTTTKPREKGEQTKFEDLPNILEYLDNVSFLDQFCDGKNNTSDIQWKTIAVKDSLALDEDFRCFDVQAKQLSSDIHRFLLNFLLPYENKNDITTILSDCPESRNIRWRQVRSSSQKELLKALPMDIVSGDKICTDYLPGLREICRSETSRNEGKRLRNSRNYCSSLSSIGSKFTANTVAVNCSVFKSS